MMKNLVIVEASGKIDALQNALRAIRLPAEVLATVGHIASNPKSLRDIGLDHALRETKYDFREDRMALLGKIQRAASGADRIYLAMDDDQEGDVIASDLAWVLTEQRDKLVRVRLRALSENELRDAFSGELSRDFDTPARNGVCRRIVDRAIGAAFSRISDAEMVPVGRVQSSLLATLDEVAPEMGRYVVTLRNGLSASLPIHTGEELARAEELARRVAAGGLDEARIVSDERVEVPVSAPWGYAEIVDTASARLNLSVGDAVQALQEAYLRGKVSYTRAEKNGYTEDAVEVAARIARQNRTQFDGAMLPRRDTGGAVAHESPRPMDDEMALGRSYTIMDAPEAVAVMVARNMIECGQLVQRRKIVLEIDAQPIEFSIDLSVPRRNWKKPAAEAGFERYSPDRALLRFMAEHGLGRPSTMVHHVEKFLQRDVLRTDGQGLGLNDKGQRWLETARAAGFTRETSAQMEVVFAGQISDPSAAAVELLKGNGMLETVHAAIAKQAREQSQLHERALDI